MIPLLRRACFLSLCLVFFVILAGSVVRTTGSGMGCPDWPKCFGHLIPPTTTEQVSWGPGKAFDAGLMIVHQGELWTANQDFTTGQGFDAANWTKYDKHDYAIYNPVHTWIEFLNRISGVAAGIPIALTFFLSVLYFLRKRKPGFFLLMGSAMVVLGLIAWLGKLVVDGNLIPAQITLHMAGSVLLVALLALVHRKASKRNYVSSTPLLHALLLTGVVLTLTQIFMGTQVREAVDHLNEAGLARELWIEQLPVIFKIHRSFSIMVLLVNGYLAWQVVQQGLGWRLQLGIMGVLGLEVLTGVILAYADVPQFMQPTHLVFAIFLFALQIYQVYLVFGKSWVRRRQSLIA